MNNTTTPFGNESSLNSVSAEAIRLHGLIRSILPACQPQEGSPANTFTDAEKEALQTSMSELKYRNAVESLFNKKNKTDGLFPTKEEKEEPTNQFSILGWEDPSEEHDEVPEAISLTTTTTTTPSYDSPQLFRQAVRAGLFTGPTNSICPGYLQCNMVVLPAGKTAFDFLLFCQRNPKACPLLEVCESYRSEKLAPGADLRTDIPQYAIYRNGKLEQNVLDATELWPEHAVVFLIGCSFSYDGALQKAGIPLKSAEQGRNVPMYETNIPCEPAGSLHGNMVVSMKPIPCRLVAQHVEITAQYPHAHGGPICVGSPNAIGIQDIDQPEWGDAIDVDYTTEIPVFHACGVTPQAVLQASGVPFAITHTAGHMLVTDQPSDMGAL